MIMTRRSEETLVCTLTEQHLAGSIQRAFFVSPDNRHLAFLRKEGTRVSVVLDDSVQGTYDDVLQLIFSPDSKRLAYVARSSGQLVVIMDGAMQGQYDAVYENTLQFSSNSARFVYAAELAGKHFVVLDGARLGEHDGILEGTPLFSNNARTQVVGHPGRRDRASI
jgi:WD40-like Beta Propeller Repeat